MYKRISCGTLCQAKRTPPDWMAREYPLDDLTVYDDETGMTESGKAANRQTKLNKTREFERNILLQKRRILEIDTLVASRFIEKATQDKALSVRNRLMIAYVKRVYDFDAQWTAAEFKAESDKSIDAATYAGSLTRSTTSPWTPPSTATR